MIPFCVMGKERLPLHRAATCVARVLRGQCTGKVAGARNIFKISNTQLQDRQYLHKNEQFPEHTTATLVEFSIRRKRVYFVRQLENFLERRIDERERQNVLKS
jgi:hypothetical protein